MSERIWLNKLDNARPLLFFVQLCSELERTRMHPVFYLNIGLQRNFVI